MEYNKFMEIYNRLQIFLKSCNGDYTELKKRMDFGIVQNTRYRHEFIDFIKHINETPLNPEHFDTKLLDICTSLIPIYETHNEMRALNDTSIEAILEKAGSIGIRGNLRQAFVRCSISLTRA